MQINRILTKLRHLKLAGPVIMPQRVADKYLILHVTLLPVDECE